MQVNFNKYQYNCNSVNSVTPSFRGNTSTMQEKIDILLSECKKLLESKKNLGIQEFEAIIKKISPTTKVKAFSEIPAGSNVSPRTCAYFSQKTDINLHSNEMICKDKVIYLNFNNNTTELSRIKLISDFVHEAVHIAQEESIDRTPVTDFTKEVLYRSSSIEQKADSLRGSVQGFNSVEYNVVLPLIQAMKKTNDLPSRIQSADRDLLDMMYQNKTGLNTSGYIKSVTKYIIGQLKTVCPNADEKFILKYVSEKAKQEKEAYTVSLSFLKDVLKIDGDTDLDLRLLLYDQFQKTIDGMI